jgi:hypothetical protein
MKVGFTGTRKGLSEKQKELLKDFFINNNITELHHGDALGADTEAHNIFISIYPNAKVVLYPSDLERANNKATNLVEYRPTPPLKRNEDIVRNCNLLIVCPKSEKEEKRSGTWATYRHAKSINKPIKILV